MRGPAEIEAFPSPTTVTTPVEEMLATLGCEEVSIPDIRWRMETVKKEDDWLLTVKLA